jgi:hypothetical protein
MVLGARSSSQHHHLFLSFSFTPEEIEEKKNKRKEFFAHTKIKEKIIIISIHYMLDTGEKRKEKFIFNECIFHRE